MALNVVRCKYCQNDFQGDLETCPHCRRRSPHGRRNLLLKWIALLVFLIVLAFVIYLFLVSPREN